MVVLVVFVMVVVVAVDVVVFGWNVLVCFGGGVLFCFLVRPRVVCVGLFLVGGCDFSC